GHDAYDADGGQRIHIARRDARVSPRQPCARDATGTESQAQSEVDHPQPRRRHHRHTVFSIPTACRLAARRAALRIVAIVSTRSVRPSTVSPTSLPCRSTRSARASLMHTYITASVLRPAIHLAWSAKIERSRLVDLCASSTSIGSHRPPTVSAPARSG